MQLSTDYQTYQGISPCPADFDSYWNASLAELASVDPAPRLTLVWDLPMTECFDLWYTGIGGAEIHARYAKPKHLTQKAPAVLMFHGYHAEFMHWDRLLYFAGQGFCTAAMECRGQGGQSEDNGTYQGNTIDGHIIRGVYDKDPRKLLMRSVYLDTVQLVRILCSFAEVDTGKLYTYGGSQGGGLALACASLAPEIRKTAVYCPFLCDFPKAYALNGGAYAEFAQHFTHFDPLHQQEDAFFERLGYIDVINLVPRMQAEVRMAVGLKDTSCPVLTQMAAFHRIQTPKELLLFPDFGHAEYPGIADAALRFFLT